MGLCRTAFRQLSIPSALQSPSVRPPPIIILGIICFSLTGHCGEASDKWRATNDRAKGTTFATAAPFDHAGRVTSSPNNISPDSNASERKLSVTAPANKSTVSNTDRLQDTGSGDRKGSIKRIALGIFYKPFCNLRTVLFGVPLWVALILTLTLERFIPAEPNRKILSSSFGHDLMWFLYEPVLHAFVVGTYVALLAKIYKSYFSYLTFSFLNPAPGWARFVIALLLLDLGYWVQHYINHKVPFLWRLHALHHSQRQLNFFTDFRYHPLEYIVRHTFVTVPFFFLNINPPVIAAVAVVKEWYSRFYHGNIRTNLGPLRYVLVTPQSHRVHHSSQPQHRDMNFGAIFSFWDFLFQKQYKGFDEYPATGIDEEQLPSEQKISLKSLVAAPWIQMARRLARH